MKKLALLFVLIFTMSIVGCGSDSSLVSSDVDNSINQAPTSVPTEGDPGDGDEGDPDGLDDTNDTP